MKKNTLVLIALVLAALGLIAPATAVAAAEPPITLEKVTPSTVLIGSAQQVTLRAHDPAGKPVGYNLTFRDVLPAGVEYTGGVSGADAPKILPDAPNPGETTLIFGNVADLSPNSQYAISFDVRADPAKWNVGETYADEAGAYVNSDPRFEPKFDAQGLPLEGATSFTGSAEATAKTRLTAVEIEKTEPSPEHELMRGVHDHQVAYHLKVRNNDYKETDSLVVDDFLPAGLEFLGCGTKDNTSKAPTDPQGGAEEYPGAGPIDPGNAPAGLENCSKPDLVETVELPGGNPQGLTPGVYTHVRWTLTGAMAPGAERELQYVAAIPIRENTMSWGSAGEPTPTSDKQGANLDNNSGPETFDEQALANLATVSGKYEGKTQVEDEDRLTVTAEDLAIQKSVSPTSINSGVPSTWTFTIETSEYRYAKDISIHDELPNGLCPLGEENYENAKQQQAECAPDGEKPSAEYASVQEQESGGFLIEWNESQAPELAEMGPSKTLKISFPTQTRVYYQENFEDDEDRPVLTHDSWTNKVKIAGADWAICAPGAPVCATPGTGEIEHEEVDGENDTDESEVEQRAAGVKIDKKVALPQKAVPVDCEAATYVDGPPPSYRPGDEVCWQVRVDFAADLFAGEPLVTDFLPPDEEYVTGSAAPVSGVNTVSVEKFTAEGNSLQWTLGESVPLGSKVFAYRFKSKVGRGLGTVPFDVEGNLMKFASANSAGETFPERDQVDIEREEPELHIVKGVYEVGGASVGGEAPADNDANATGAHGGQRVKYGIQVKTAARSRPKAWKWWTASLPGWGVKR